jgi:catechol 2,3-dioxygenase-like lactoylglutathione lyase family enzyme
MVEMSAVMGGERPLIGPVSTIRLFCEDLDKTADFYRDVLRLPEMFREPDAALFKSGQVGLLVEKGDPND